MNEFYYAQDWGTVLDVPNILLSFGVVLYPSGRFKHYNLDHAKKLFLDCGAYSLRNKLTHYPLKQYYQWIRILDHDNLAHVATVDIIGDMEGTVKAGIECLRSENSFPWVPVIQGNSAPDYIECIHLYEKEGFDLSKPLIAVGGLKGRDHMSIRTILTSLKRWKIHAFGLTLAHLRDPSIWNSIFSTDTGTWKQRPSTTKQKYQQLEKFKKDLDLLTRDYDAQTTFS
jgi:hypothetical protein